MILAIIRSSHDAGVAWRGETQTDGIAALVAYQSEYAGPYRAIVRRGRRPRRPAQRPGRCRLPGTRADIESAPTVLHPIYYLLFVQP